MSVPIPHGGQQVDPPGQASLPPEVRLPFSAYVLFVLVAIGILVAGGLFYRAQRDQLRKTAEDEVWTVARMKAEQIENWRAERLGDAGLVSDSPPIERVMANWLTDPGSEHVERILAHLHRMQQNYHYSDVLTVDIHGRVRLSVTGKSKNLDGEFLGWLKEDLKGPILSDLHTHPGDSAPHMEAIAPIHDRHGAEPRLVGAVILVIDAQEFLYPLFRGWPLPRNSPETLLVRRTGEEFLVLNELRHHPDAAFRLKISGQPAHEPAGSPEQRVRVGQNYDGVEVLSATVPVKNSPWFLVAEIDSAEALAPMRFQTRLIIALVAGLLSAVGGGVVLLRQRMQRNHFRTAYEAEVALRQSESKNRAIVTAMPDFMFRLSSDGVHLDFHSPNNEKLFPDPQEFLGKDVSEVLPRDVGETYKVHIREALETGRTQIFSYHLDFSDGTRYFETRMAACGDNEALAIVRNITERKRDEEEIRRLLAQVREDAAELEKRVAERTAQLSEANAELEAFAYSVSHDLKAPLRGIDGYSRLLEQDYADKLDEDGLLFIHNVRACTAQMQQLIEDLLSYSRMERRPLQVIPLDLPLLVQRVAAELAAEVNQTNVLLHLEVPSLKVRADQDGLAIVLRNLLENAIKFSREAVTPTVEIGARNGDGKAVLWVRDNGIGFDMKFHNRIFEIFQRLQRSEEYPGTGIGLALVRKAMQRMGGRAWAESAPGEGATFYLEIPL